MEWEYKVVAINVKGGHVNEEEITESLNDLGAEGWELLSVSSILAEAHTTSMVHHFRRPSEHKRRAGFSA